MPCNVLKESGRACNKPAVYFGDIYDKFRDVFIETQTCVDCYAEIKGKKEKAKKASDIPCDDEDE